MRILATRSVPLSRETADAWRNNGITFRRRLREVVWDPRFHEPHFEAVLNLGNLDMDFKSVPVPIFNPPVLVRAISSPSQLRANLGELLPEATRQGPHWHKQVGMKGKGKTLHVDLDGSCVTWGGDVQKHIDGQEYRILSVNDNVVQASKKYGDAPNFTFEWVGVQGITRGGFIPLIHEAAEKLRPLGNSVIGWDVIHDGTKPYIIEANTSPGVNPFTAARIVNAMKEVVR